MKLYERLLWPLLRRMDTEFSHDSILAVAAIAQALPLLPALLHDLMGVRDKRLEVQWGSLTFPNPIGLAAGLDKDARAPHTFMALGFGFVEVGTVTPLPQPGNPKPRIRRVPERLALINSMGFPGKGSEQMAERLSRKGRRRALLGINLGKNAKTPLEEAERDYVSCLERLYAYGDYFVINVSSPNTQGLTSLQTRPRLEAILREVLAARVKLAMGSAPRPLAVKVSPDLTARELEDVLDVVAGLGIDGIVATNTSADAALKGGLKDVPGGLSGVPLHQRSLDMVRSIRSSGPRGLFIFGAGGILDTRGALDFLEAGADVVQLYTGLVYQGPGLPGTINRGLLRHLAAARADGIRNLAKTRS